MQMAQKMAFIAGQSTLVHLSFQRPLSRSVVGSQNGYQLEAIIHELMKASRLPFSFRLRRRPAASSAARAEPGYGKNAAQPAAGGHW